MKNNEKKVTKGKAGINSNLTEEEYIIYYR